MRKTVLALACVLLAPMFLVGVTVSAPYDPWSDLDADGDIDIFDIVKIAGSYATTGDPGKNVSVTNWPSRYSATITGYATRSESLGFNVEPAGLHQIDIDTAGYREITLGIRPHPTRTIYLYTIWMVGASSSREPYAIEDMMVGDAGVLKTYPVHGEVLRVLIENLSLDIFFVHVDYYLTA